MKEERPVRADATKRRLNGLELLQAVALQPTMSSAHEDSLDHVPNCYEDICASIVRLERLGLVNVDAEGVVRVAPGAPHPRLLRFWRPGGGS